MPDYAIFDAATGQRSAAVPAPGERLAPAATQRDPLADWHPNDSPINPADEPYDLIGDEIAPAEGEVPANIVTAPGPFSRSKGL